jgi:ribonuclease BN (tRNA processing enzyme)
MSLRLTVLGSSGSWPAPGRATSGYVVENQDTRIVVDLGFGTMERLADPLAVDAVVVSHRHPDHCIDVLALYHLWGYGDAPRTGVPLIGPRSVIDALAAFLGAGPDHRLWSVFAPDAVVHGDTRTVGGMTLDFVGVDHSVETVGTRVESDGRSVFYGADTGSGGNWWETVRPPTVAVLESTWQGSGPGGDYTKHLTATEAGRIGAAMTAERLVVTHLTPGLDPLRSIAEAKTTFPGTVSHADPGLTIEV